MWPKKKPDPINDRARALTEEIAALEEQIRRLDSQLQHTQAHPRLRSTAMPHGATIHRAPELFVAPVAVEEPIFEKVDHGPLDARAENGGTPEHYNELGVRKYDLPALVGRIRNHFRAPTTNNPKLVNYLAAGGVQGLRPLRYEKRVARNRFIFFATVLFFAMLGIVLWFCRIH